MRDDIEFQVRTQNGFLGAHGADRARFAAAAGCGPVFAAELEEIERSGEVWPLFSAAAPAPLFCCDGVEAC